VFDLTAGKYDLVVQAGPSFTTRREETSAALTDAIRGNPQFAGVLLPLLLDTLDVPGIDKIKAHIEQIQQQNAGGPQAQKAQADMMRLQAENAALKQELALAHAQHDATKQIATMQQNMEAAKGAMERTQADAASQLKDAMNGLEQQKMAIERQNANTDRIKADAALLSAIASFKTAITPQPAPAAPGPDGQPAAAPAPAAPMSAPDLAMAVRDAIAEAHLLTHGDPQ
jgi:hypothetical protein